MNTIKVNHSKRTIEMDRVFYKASLDVRSDEYRILQQVRKDYPNYQPMRKTAKKNPDKKTYRGLTYEYMEEYICAHESEATKEAVLREFHEKILISKCHSDAYRYPKIKKWFLEKYKEIADFGVEQKPAEPSNKNDYLKALGF
jgi:hypothetical protein